MTQRTNFSVRNNLGQRITPDLIIGKHNGYRSGDILDANATKEMVKDALLELIAGAPEDLNDFRELADALKEKADKATTLEGYGIDDTYTKQEIIQIVENANHGTDEYAYADDSDINNMFNGDSSNP